MQNIHVNRYQSPNSYQGCIEPEDRSWIVFVRNDGLATFWRRTEITVQSESPGVSASTQHVYCDAEVPLLRTDGDCLPPIETKDRPSAGAAAPLDYTIHPAEGGFKCSAQCAQRLRVWRDRARCSARAAELRRRAVHCWGTRPHRCPMCRQSAQARVCLAVAARDRMTPILAALMTFGAGFTARSQLRSARWRSVRRRFSESVSRSTTGAWACRSCLATASERSPPYAESRSGSRTK